MCRRKSEPIIFLAQKTSLFEEIVDFTTAPIEAQHVTRFPTYRKYQNLSTETNTLLHVGADAIHSEGYSAEFANIQITPIRTIARKRLDRDGILGRRPAPNPFHVAQLHRLRVEARKRKKKKEAGE